MEDSPDPSRSEYKHGLLEPSGWGSATYRQDVSANQHLLTELRVGARSPAGLRGSTPPTFTIHPQAADLNPGIFSKKQCSRKVHQVGSFSEDRKREVRSALWAFTIT